MFRVLEKKEIDGSAALSAKVKHLGMILKVVSGQIISSYFSAYELSSCGASKNYQGDTMGMFEFVPGVEKEGSPVYRQAHSRELQTDDDDYLLFRWEKPLFFPPQQIRQRVAGWARG